MLQLRNTSDEGCNEPPDEIVFSFQLKKQFIFVNRLEKFPDPSVQGMSRKSWKLKEGNQGFTNRLDKLNQNFRFNPYLQIGGITFSITTTKKTLQNRKKSERCWIPFCSITTRYWMAARAALLRRTGSALRSTHPLVSHATSAGDSSIVRRMLTGVKMCHSICGSCWSTTFSALSYPPSECESSVLTRRVATNTLPSHFDGGYDVVQNVLDQQLRSTTNTPRPGEAHWLQSAWAVRETLLVCDIIAEAAKEYEMIWNVVVVVPCWFFILFVIYYFLFQGHTRRLDWHVHLLF